MNNTEPPIDDADLLARIQRDPEVIDEVLEQLAPLLAADGIDLQNFQDVDQNELHAAMTRAIERHQLEWHTPVGDARALTRDTMRDLARALGHQKPASAEHIFLSLPLEPTPNRPSSGYVLGVTLETLDRIYTDKKLRTALGVVRLPELTDATRAAAQDVQASAAQGQAFNSRDKLVTAHSTHEVGRAAIHLFASTTAAIAEHSKLQFNAVLDQLLAPHNVTD